tara:strand:+ start:304 stop:984 length:681 start_codon:yes stop_codon:yes gene_type:complete
LSGKLYIISTPIGNLSDISSRALEILSSVNLIAAEDTRVSRKLLNHYKIKNKLISYNDFNENFKAKSLLGLLKNDKNIAVISDAGTPCISDPGYRIVNMALINNIKVISIPGATSLIAALSISGLPSDKFFFEGFLPKKKGLNKRMKILSKLDATIIIFESPKRVVKTLNKILDFMGDRVVSLCKEITKIHETTYFGRISEVLDKISQNTIKGEFIIMVAKEGYEI